MFLAKKMLLRVFIVFLLFASFITVKAVYDPSNQKTNLQPVSLVYNIVEPTESELLYETANFTYSFRESRDTITIYDKRNDYTWTTGTDLEFSAEIANECEEIVESYEDQFSNVDFSTFTDFTNSTDPLLTDIEFYGTNFMLKALINDVDENFTKDSVLLQTSLVTLTNGTQYQLSFEAYGLSSRNIEVQVGSVYTEEITVTNELAEYTMTFTMSDPTANVTVDFLLGYFAADAISNTTLYFDNIELNEYDGVDVVDGTNQIQGDFELDPLTLETTQEDVLDVCRDREVRLNTTYTGFANSLVTIEYFDSASNIKRISSASRFDAESLLYADEDDESHFILDIDFKDADIEVLLNIYFDDEGIRYEILDEDVTGDGILDLAAIIISPFLGASGGAYESFDITEMDYLDEEHFKYKVPGYSLVPDGSGSLIQFNDNTVDLNEFNASVYGFDPGQADHYLQESAGYVPFKTASMPVFGMAHEDVQAAFVAFATSGDEFMQIISMPEENLTYYNFTYPRFEYNKQYYQVYNKSGAGYLTFYDDRNHYDIEMRYNFLSGDGTTGYSGDYVGMAHSYRDYLVSQDLLQMTTNGYNDIPIRLDFLMSDVEKGITGFNNQVTTTSSQVDQILSMIMDNGITNINSGLLGWNDGGITLGDPRDTDFIRQIGKQSEFEELIRTYQSKGVDISFNQDYYRILEEMMTLRNNASKNTSTWYSRLETFDYPVSMFYFARPVKSIEWLQDQANTFDSMGVASYSISGITNNLTSDYSTDMLRDESRDVLVAGFDNLNKDVLINAYQPNMYLWEYTDRYLQTPVYGTQYLIETDTVPFIQLVLQNTMELYGPYANFSFYTDSDILRMIDYNIYPSFVLTHEPAYLLTDTLSRTYYSTEYNLYFDLINHVYENVNGALNNVVNANWINRSFIDDGIVLNEYDNNVMIIINYTDESYMYSGVSVEPVSYAVIGG